MVVPASLVVPVRFFVGDVDSRGRPPGVGSTNHILCELARDGFCLLSKCEGKESGIALKRVDASHQAVPTDKPVLDVRWSGRPAHIRRRIRTQIDVILMTIFSAMLLNTIVNIWYDMFRHTSKYYYRRSSTSHDWCGMTIFLLEPHCIRPHMLWLTTPTSPPSGSAQCVNKPQHQNTDYPIALRFGFREGGRL